MDQHTVKRTRASRIAVSTCGDATRGIDSKDGAVVAIIDVCKSLIHGILHADVVDVAARRVRLGKECPFARKGHCASRYMYNGHVLEEVLALIEVLNGVRLASTSTRDAAVTGPRKGSMSTNQGAKRKSRQEGNEKNVHRDARQR